MTSMTWHRERRGSTAVANNLRAGCNTSSIMVGNAPSIMQREAGRVTPG
jgi:hypothetical protein